ncbi:peptidyl-prolyl cis-trans isomerase-like 3 isoform X1 [Paroedura picta]|uniref:peptidyl-prolyl cis-trans isomerase-like 3 isoform X1 n=2 Tax=Paroedura picta TaxID=143630 RepID=UPI004056ACC3
MSLPSRREVAPGVSPPPSLPLPQPDLPGGRAGGRGLFRLLLFRPARSSPPSAPPCAGAGSFETSGALGPGPAQMAVTLHTDVGDVKIELFCERTPKACENFLALCASNYYSGCIFHRNIKGFMVQTGDPTGSGKGGSSIWGRKFEDEFSEYLKHSVRGVVSMANNGPSTNGSQFFITYGKQPHLDMKYTVFGKVIDGLDTLDELEKLPVNEKTFRPLNDVHVKDVTIHANPFAM